MKIFNLLAAISVMLTLASCGQPIRLESKSDVIVVDVQFLGEYPSDVSKIQLVNSTTGKVVWSVVPKGGDRFQIHTLELHAGENAAEPLLSWGQARVEVPTARILVLQPHVLYRVQVCSPGWFGRCRSAAFKLPAAATPANSALHRTRTGALLHSEGYNSSRRRFAPVSFERWAAVAKSLGGAGGTMEREDPPSSDHFLHRDFAGFTDAATPDQRILIVRELSGFGDALRNQSIPMPDLEELFKDEGIDFQLDIDDEDRFELTDEEIRAGARMRVFLEGHRWLIRLRDTESKRIVFQAAFPWMAESFAPRL